MARRTLLLVCLLALLPYAWLTHRFDWVCDDAFISFRYALHLAEGHGLRYNVAEQPPVEGYSNFLWVLAMTPFEAMGWPSPGPSRWLSVACGAVLLFRLAAFLARRLALGAPAVTVAAVFFATLPSVAMWSTSGLETIAFALLIFAAFENLGRPGRTAAALACCVGLILIRAEGFAWVGVLIALAGLHAWFGDYVRPGGPKDRSALRPLAQVAAGSAVATAVLIGFRLWYFGYPLPNTVYAKAGFSLVSLERGARYAASYLLVFPHLALILFAGIAVAIADPRSRRLLVPPLILAAAVFAYAMAVGGDFMPMGRLLVPALPLFAVVLAVLVERIAQRPLLVAALAATLVAASLLPAFDRHPVPLGVRQPLHFRWNMKKFDSELLTWRRMKNRVDMGIDLARVLSAHTLPGESLPYGRLGALGYHSELHILDQNGLVNLEVAHREPPPWESAPPRRSAGHDKHVPRTYFLKHRPEVYRVRLESTLPDEGRLEYVSELLRMDQAPGYAPLFFPVESSFGSFLLLAKRKDLIPDLPAPEPATENPGDGPRG